MRASSLQLAFAVVVVVVVAVVVTVDAAAQQRKPVSYEGYKVYTVRPDEKQLEHLSQFRNKNGYDFWTTTMKPHKNLTIMVAPSQQDSFMKFLQDEDIGYQITIYDAEKVFSEERMLLRSAPQSRGGNKVISFSKFNTYEEINAYVNELAAIYPSLVTVETLTTTYEGREMRSVKVSSGGGGSKPVILVDSAIHAREWIAPAAGLYALSQIVENASNSYLLDLVDWHFIPLVNPDGYVYSMYFDRMWRKNRAPVSGSLCHGVDPNRNFDFHWNEYGSSDDPCSLLFSGLEPFSEFESVALSQYLLANKDRIKLYLTLHSYGPYFLYPWGFTSNLPDNWQTLDSLAQAANDAQARAGGPNYEIGSSTNVLYAASGASDDFGKGVAGIELVYTVELPGGGSQGFDPPASRIMEMVVPFFEAIRTFGEYVANNYSK